MSCPARKTHRNVSLPRETVNPDQDPLPLSPVLPDGKMKDHKTDENKCCPEQPTWWPARNNCAQRYRWMFIAFASACFYATMAMLVSSLADEVDTTVVSFSRSFVTCVLSLIIACYNGTKMAIPTMAEFKFHALNGLFTVSTIYLQFYAYQHMDAADASAIIYSYVAFTGLFGRLFLKETFALFEITMVALTFAGIVFVARPPILFQFFDNGILENSVGIVPPLVAFAASLSVALHIVTLRAMGRQNMEVMKLLFYATLLSSIVLAFSIVISRQSLITLCSLARVRLLLMAVCGFSGYALLTYALSMEDSVYVSLVSINDVFIVFAMSILILGFRPEWTSIVGVFLIMSSSTVILLRKILVYRKKDQTEGNQSNQGHLNISVEPDHPDEQYPETLC